jgi:hypothetical protein
MQSSYKEHVCTYCIAVGYVATMVDAFSGLTPRTVNNIFMNMSLTRSPLDLLLSALKSSNVRKQRRPPSVSFCSRDFESEKSMQWGGTICTSLFWPRSLLLVTFHLRAEYNYLKFPGYQISDRDEVVDRVIHRRCAPQIEAVQYLNSGHGWEDSVYAKGLGLSHVKLFHQIDDMCYPAITETVLAHQGVRLTFAWGSHLPTFCSRNRPSLMLEIKSSNRFLSTM